MVKKYYNEKLDVGESSIKQFKIQRKNKIECPHGLYYRKPASEFHSNRIAINISVYMVEKTQHQKFLDKSAFDTR